MPIYTVKLIAQKQEAQHTWSFRCEKPADFSFLPGQFAGFTLMQPGETDGKGNTRRFSFACSPQESHLTFTTRVRDSAFKRVLSQLTPGIELKMAGPAGSFTLHDDTSIPAVFIAGGIGITPFYSMLLDAADKQSSMHMHLFYSNRYQADVTYFKELHALKERHPQFTFVPTLTRETPSADLWPYEKGYIDLTLLKKYIPDLRVPIFYICGSDQMVKSMTEQLQNAGVPLSHIRSEDFIGY